MVGRSAAVAVLHVLAVLVVGNDAGGSEQPGEVESAGKLWCKVCDGVLPPQRACRRWGGWVCCWVVVDCAMTEPSWAVAWRIGVLCRATVSVLNLAARPCDCDGLRAPAADATSMNSPPECWLEPWGCGLGG